MRWGEAAWMELTGTSAVGDHHGLAGGSEVSGEGDRAWLVQRAQRREGWP